MNQSKMSLKKKIWFLAIFQIVTMTVVGVVGWYFNQQQYMTLRDFAKVNLPSVRYIKMLDTHHDVIQSLVLRGLSFTTTISKEKKDELQKETEKIVLIMNNNILNLEKLDLDSDIIPEVQKAKTLAAEFLKVSEEIINFVINGNLVEAHKKNELFEKGFVDLSSQIDKLNLMIDNMVDNDFLSGEKSSQQSNQISIFLIFIGLTAGLFFSYLTIQYIINNLTQALRQITEESNDVNQIAVQINTASQDLSQATTEQSAAIEETVASSEEMASMLSQTTQHTSKSLNITEEGRTESQRGLQVMTRLGNAMDEIQQTNEKLESLVRLIEEIKSKTKVINDIVFETRLLSFNASIEAARAGSHGKGFAIVAEEVGKLATMSGKAADEIRTLLDSSTSEVSMIVRNTQEKVSVGKNVSLECQTVFKSMGETLLKIDESVTKIASASKEQEIGIKQTNRAMAELDKVTNTNSQASEKLAAQSDNLYRSSKAMDVTMKNIQVLVFGEERDSSLNEAEGLHNKEEENSLSGKSEKKKNHFSVKSKHKKQQIKGENVELNMIPSEKVISQSQNEEPSRSSFKWKKSA